jgi:CRISPR-associated protein Csy3
VLLALNGSHRLVDGKPENTWTFDALALSLRGFDAPEFANADLNAVAQLLAQGLAGQSHVLLHVTAFVRMGAGQEVYPSQKLGNAIRTIDTWYSGAADNGPIAVEPYGSVTTQGKAYRQPKAKEDFYTLFDNWVTKGQAPALEQQHFVIATLIRGGVFGDAGKE